MYLKALLVIMFVIISLGLSAQGKLYITPRIGFHSGSYSGVNSINNKQNIFSTRKFMRKDFLVGLTLGYHHRNVEVSAGIEEGVYASGFYYGGDKNRLDNVVNKSSVAIDYRILFAELKCDVLSWNIKMPNWINKNAHTEKPYLMVSRIMPMVGFEWRKLRRDGPFVNHFEEFGGASTLMGSVPYAVSYNAYKKKQFSLRAGVDWVFYDGAERRFMVNLMYSFAFKDAGYYHYRFYHDTPREFHYRNTTRGNGISLKIGVPIKLFEAKKKKL